MDPRRAFLSLALALVQEELGHINRTLLVPMPDEEFALLVKEAARLLERYRAILSAMRK